MKRIIIGLLLVLAGVPAAFAQSSVNAHRVDYAGIPLDAALDTIKANTATTTLSNVGAATLGKLAYVSSTATCSDVQTALATGNSVYIPRGVYTWNDCYLTMNTSGQSLIGAGRDATFVIFTYTGSPTGPAITVGNSGSTPARVDSVTIRNLRITTAIGHYAIRTRYVRGLRLIDNHVTADGFLQLGDNALIAGCNPSAPSAICSTYIVELYDGNELHELPSPTLHFVKAENFGGQFVSQNTFAEGQFAAGIDGFHGAGNLVDLEHGIVEGGYWSRFDVNWNFKESRPAGWFFSHHFSELALTNAFRFETTGSGVDEGCNNIHIDNTQVDAVNEAILFRTSSGKTCQGIVLNDITASGGSANAKSLILMDAPAGTLKRITIGGLLGSISATAGQDLVYLKGSSGATLHDVQVGRVFGESTSANALRSVVRIEGTGNTDVSVGSQLAGVNASVALDDQSGVAIRPREVLTASRTYYVRSDGADTNNCLANTTAGACLTIQAAWDKIALLDLRGQIATIQIADATYSGGLQATKVPLGGGTVVIRGNSSTPGNVLISTTSASALSFPTPIQALVSIRDVQLQTTTGSGIDLTAANKVQFFNILFAACAAAHMSANAPGAVLTAFGAYSITGSAAYHVVADLGGKVILDNRTVTITGTPAFSSFISAFRMSYVSARSAVYLGTTTGNRYSVSSAAVVDTNSAGANFFPGGSPGGTATGGQYI